MTNDELAKKNIKLPEIIVNKCFSTYHDKDELLSLGYDELYQAILKHDRNRQNTFTSYAYRYIWGKMINYIKKSTKQYEYQYIISYIEFLEISKPEHLDILYEIKEYQKNNPSIYQQRVIDLYLQGYRAVEIADKLGLKRRVIYNHLSNFIAAIEATL
jgi:DNA-directed RNA polymerase specialized sigma24 family protein